MGYLKGIIMKLCIKFEINLAISKKVSKMNVNRWEIQTNRNEDEGYPNPPTPSKNISILESD